VSTPAETALARVRELCLALPETSERPSHGAPTFFIREKRSFVTFHDDHHGDGRLAIWCAAPPGAQAMLVGSAPDTYFVPAYVGHLGWLGMRLDSGQTGRSTRSRTSTTWRLRASMKSSSNAE